MKILIVGSGDIGTAVAHALDDKGVEVTALRRSLPTYHDIKYIQADITKMESLKALDTDFTHVLFIAAPDTRSETAYQSLYAVGLLNVLNLLPQATFMFISSTAVYGQSQGEWVDEDSVTKPTNFRGKILLEAEKAVLSHNKKNTVIRFSGIYGRGGNHILAKLKKKQAIQYEPPYFTNRIHREDCIGVILFLLEHYAKYPYRIYLATDSNPLLLYEVASEIAKKHDLSVPEKVYHDGASNQNKRLRNGRLKELGYMFKYPSYTSS